LLFNSGRVVNVTSVKGLFVWPFTAAYAMTKFAVEAFSDALRVEMNKFGVTVSVVEPGHFGGATESLNVCLLHRDGYRLSLSVQLLLRSRCGRICQR